RPRSFLKAFRSNDRTSSVDQISQRADRAHGADAIPALGHGRHLGAARLAPQDWNGVCHFIEHAVFKGTERRTALDIAVESDRLGGHFDAYTTHEMTGFALKVVDTAMPSAFDLLADMLARPRFD